MTCWLFSHCLHSKCLTIPILSDGRPRFLTAFERLVRKSAGRPCPNVTPSVFALFTPHYHTTRTTTTAKRTILLHEQRDSRCFHIPASPTSHIIPSSRHLPCYPTLAPTSLETYDNYVSLLSTPLPPSSPRPILLQA